MRKPVLCLCGEQKGADQPTHPNSLISTFVVRFLDSIIPLVSISEILRLAALAGLSTLVENPEDRFSRDEAHLRNHEEISLTLQRLNLQPRHEKTCLQGFQPGETQTNLLSYRS